jgi:hypothetical protein
MLRPRQGFNWMAVSWGGAYEPPADNCSYCDAPLYGDSVPLIRPAGSRAPRRGRAYLRSDHITFLRDDKFALCRRSNRVLSWPNRIRLAQRRKKPYERRTRRIRNNSTSRGGI